MPVRRVALIQVHSESEWSPVTMPAYLAVAADLGADLAVFPEAFPYWRGKRRAPHIEDAKRELTRIACPAALAFIAGGYVFDEHGYLRNAVFLVHGGDASQRYFKRIAWADDGPNEVDEQYKYVIAAHRHEEPVLFRWSGGSCVPLICADVYGPTDADGNRQWLQEQLNRIRQLKPDVVVVPAYAGYIAEASTKRWQESLRLCCEQTGDPPVAFCNFAGKDEKTKFGGGGSALYLPDGKGTLPATPPTDPGVYVVDLP